MYGRGDGIGACAGVCAVCVGRARKACGGSGQLGENGQQRAFAAFDKGEREQKTALEIKSVLACKSVVFGRSGVAFGRWGRVV